jgi:transposase InsO family protein
MKKQRKQYAPEEKVAILRRHLLEKDPYRSCAMKWDGPQFIAKDFKEFIRISGMTHVRTSPYYPHSNGKTERWHKSLKGSGRERHCRWRTRGGWWRATWDTTTMSA